MKKIAIGIGVLITVSVCFFYNSVSTWKCHTGNCQIENFDFLRQQTDGSYQATGEIARLFKGCYGFTGECLVKGYRLVLEFDGVSFRVPRFSLFNSFGGSSGLQWPEAHFGRRVLKVFDLRGEVVGLFSQKMWNRIGYGDFGQILFFDEGTQKLYLSEREFIGAVKENGYVLNQFSK